MTDRKTLLAIVGMPGSGKSEICKYLMSLGFVSIRFGDITDEEIKRQNLEQNPRNEEKIRNELRSKFGMDVYARKSLPKIEEALGKTDLVVIDGLYSWEELVLLKSKFRDMVVISVFTDRDNRYKRLSSRQVRPLSQVEVESRDMSEIENLSKAKPIAMADFTVLNNGDLTSLHSQVDNLLKKI